jgi:hypothetical protein
MSKFKLILVLAGFVPAVSWSQGPCDLQLELLYDTYCVSESGFYLPILNSANGSYSGDFVDSYGYFNSLEAGAGPQSVVYTANPELCAVVDTIQFTLVLPGLLSISGDSVICEGDSALLFAPEGYAYDWGSGIRSNSFLFFPDSTTTYLISGLDENGCGVEQSFTITVSSISPNVSLLGPTYLCFGEPATYEVQGTSDFIWNDGSESQIRDLTLYQDSIISVVIGSAPECDTTLYLNVDVSDELVFQYSANTSLCGRDSLSIQILSGNASYYRINEVNFIDSISFIPPSDFQFIVAFNDSGCYAIDFIQLQITESPVLEIYAPERLCSGDEVYISVTGAPTIEWIDLNTGASLETVGGYEYFSIATDSISIQVSASNELNCSATSIIEVPVEQLPLVQIDSLTAFCLDREARVTVSGADYYVWNNSFNTNDTLTYIPSGDTVFTVLGSTVNGCFAYDTLEIIAHPNPEVFLLGEYSICELDTTVLIGFGAERYFWYGEEGTDTLLATPWADSIFTLVGMNVYGCTDTATYFLDVKPAPQNIFVGESELCAGETTIIQFYTDAQLFQWESGSSQSTLFVDPVDDTSFTVTSIGANGCQRISTFEVVVNDYPEVEIVGNTTVCFGDTLTLVASGAEIFQWNNGLSGDTISFVPFVSGVVRVEGYNGDCSGEGAIGITVNPSPFVLFSFSEDTLCTSGSGANWVASPAGGLFSGDGVVNNWFVLNAAESGPNTVTYTYTNNFNCSTSVTDVIVIETCLDVEESNLKLLTPYPNPFANQLILETMEGDESIEIFNSVGSLIYVGTINERTVINTADWTAGTYIIRLNKSGHVNNHRIVKIDG